MKNKKEWIYSIITIAIIVVVGGSVIIVKGMLEAPFNKDIEAAGKAISENNLKEANIEYNKALNRKYKNTPKLVEVDSLLGTVQFNREEYNKGMEALNENKYKEAINDFQEIIFNKGNTIDAEKELNIATTKFLDEEYKKIEPELNAKHYMEAYSKLQNIAGFIDNKSRVTEYLNRIKALENVDNISLYKATGIALNTVNGDESNVHTMVGQINSNYITYSYPTGKINFITKEQNGIIDGQEGYLYLIRQAQRVNNNLYESGEYFYMFVNMESGKTSVYDESILKSFKSTFKVTEFTGEDPVAVQYMKKFNIPNCFMALEGALRNKNENKITHLKTIYDESKFINEVPGYMELYNKPHQLFQAYCEQYYLVTQEEIYKIQGNKLIKEAKTNLNQELQ